MKINASKDSLFFEFSLPFTLHMLLFIAHKHNLNNQATSAVQDTELNSYRTYFVLHFLEELHDKTVSAIDSTLPPIL